MTDLTDQDRRAARQWADEMNGHPILNENARAAVRYVLATVDAPEPTLAEELARIAENSAVWTIQNVCDELKSAAASAEQMERDLAEARADVKRLTAELETEPVALEVNVATDQQANMQGILAGSLPDPADVKPGEAWIVDVDGERRPAMKDGEDYFQWNTITGGGWLSSVGNSDVTLIARLAPAPRAITNADDLDRAKRCTVIRDAAGVVCERDGMGDAWTTFTSLSNQRPHITLPATVLWEPEV